MAAVFGKNVKIPNAQARCMLLFNSVKSSSSHLKKTYPLVYLNQNKLLSTAAQKLVVGDEFFQRKKAFSEPRMSDGEPFKNIDKALADIDNYVRRAGRVSKRSVEEVVHMMKDAGGASSTEGLYLLRCCERMMDETPEGRVRMADQIWEMLQGYGMQFETAHYNSRLRLYVENGHDFSPGEILSTMENQEIEPNKVTYRYLMEKCCADGNLAAASEILEFLKAKGIPVDENIFNALIKGYFNSGDFEGAENILEVMKSSNLAPNADSYTALACGYAKQGDLDRMKAHMKGSLSNKHLLQIIDALAVSGHREAIDEVMPRMSDVFPYRQDFINAAIELVHKNLDHVAYRLVLAVSTPNFNSPTNIFLKQMLKSRRPVESIIKYADSFLKRGLNDIIFLNLAKAAVDNEMMDYAICMLEEMHKRGMPVRDYYLTPIFLHFERTNSKEGVLMILRKMAEFGIPPDFTMYRHRILPALGVVNAQDLIARLEREKLPTTSALDALFDFYCSVGKSDLAYNLLESHSIQVNHHFDLKSFVSAFRNSNVDPATYFKVLKFVTDNIGAYLLAQDQDVIQGRFLAELIQLDAPLFDVFQRKMDCNFSSKCLQVCREELKRKAPQLLMHLRKLQNNEADVSEEEAEKQLATLKDQGLPTKFFLFDRLMYHIKRRNIDKINEIKTSLEEQGFELSPATCAQLISIYSEGKDFDMVQELMQNVKKKHPDFKLDKAKAVEYASLLVKYEKFDEAIQTLESALSDGDQMQSRTFLSKCIRKLFNLTAECGNSEFVRKLRDFFMPHADRLIPMELILAPLIKYHAFKGDLVSALDEFRKCVQQHRLAPCLDLLLTKCIVSNDQDTLQKVLNVTTSYFGEAVATSELAAALLDTGRFEQALKAVEALKDKSNLSHIEEICTRMYNRNKVMSLHQFIQITRGLPGLKREKVYHLLLSMYAKRNNIEQTTKVLKVMEQEGIRPSQQTSGMIYALYRGNDLTVPSDLLDRVRPEEQEPLGESLTSNDFKEKFLEYMNQEEWQKALDELKRMKKGHVRSISIPELTQLVDLLLRKKNLMALSSNVFAMSYLIEHVGDVFQPLLEKYSEAGDVESLQSISDLLPDFSLRKVVFNRFYCGAFIASGKQEELLLEMEKNFGNKNKVFSTPAFQELLRNPNLEERCNQLAERYLESNFDVPMAAVWANHFTNENYEKAEAILKRQGVAFDKVDPTVLQTIRKMENISMGKKYIEILGDRPAVRQRTKERAYGALLDVLVLKGEYDEAASLAARGEKLGLPLHKYYSSTLVTLKNALEREGKPVPFSVFEDSDFVSQRAV